MHIHKHTQLPLHSDLLSIPRQAHTVWFVIYPYTCTCVYTHLLKTTGGCQLLCYLKSTVNIILLSLMCKVSKQIPFHSKFSVCSRQFSQATSRSFSLQSLGHSVVRKLHHHLSFPAPTPCCPFLQTHVRKLVSESWCSGTPVAQQGCANRGHVPFLPFLRKITSLFPQGSLI